MVDAERLLQKAINHSREGKHVCRETMSTAFFVFSELTMYVPPNLLVNMMFDGLLSRSIANDYDSGRTQRKRVASSALNKISGEHSDWLTNPPKRKVIVNFLNGKTS